MEVEVIKMNKCIFTGKVISIQKPIGKGPAFIKIAANREYLSKENKPITDIVPLKCWGKWAEEAVKLKINDMITVNAHVKISSYNVADEKRWSTDLEVDYIENLLEMKFSVGNTNNNQCEFAVTEDKNTIEVNKNIGNNNLGANSKELEEDKSLIMNNRTEDVFGDIEAVGEFDPFEGFN